MKRAFWTAMVFGLWLAAPAAQALTLPTLVETLYFVGSTQQLYKIRAAVAVLDCEDNPQIQTCVYAGGPPTCSWGVNPHCGTDVISAPFAGAWQVLNEPWGMGAVDCMGAYLDGTANFLGRTAMVDGEPVVVPGYEDLVTQPNWPGECYGYQFHAMCSGWMGPYVCHDPVAVAKTTYP